MKLTKVIILIFLIVKSTIGFGAVATLFNTDHKCCSDQIEIEDCSTDNQSEQDDEQGCCGDNCHCTCCSPVLIPLYHTEEKTHHTNVLTASIANYVSIYNHQFNNGVWQPPREV